MYVELDHDLVPRRIEDIEDESELETGKNKADLESIVGKFNARQTIKNVNKYPIRRGPIQDMIQVIKEEHKESFEESEEMKEMTWDFIENKNDRKFTTLKPMKVLTTNLSIFLFESIKKIQFI